MTPSPIHKQLHHPDDHARRLDASARLAAYIEASARDGHDADTARKLLRAFEEMQALHAAGSVRRSWSPPS